MVSGDFDEDGIQDLAVGYGVESGGSISVLRGNPEAITPRTQADVLAAAKHEYVNPFVQEWKGISTTAQPDIILSADVDGDGHLDLITAARGATSLYVWFGTGKGTFSKRPSAITVAGGITALAAYRPGPPVLGEAIVVGYQHGLGGRLAIVTSGTTGLRTSANYALPGAPRAFSVANLDSDLIPDIAIVAGGEVLVLHGANARNGRGRLEVLPVNNAETVTAGDFLFDRHGLLQLAVLTSSGELLYLAHEGLDPRPYTASEIASARHNATRHGSQTATLAQQAGDNGSAPWVEVDRKSDSAFRLSGSDTPVMLRSRSGGGGDDLVLLNPSQQQRVMIRPALTPPRPASPALAAVGSPQVSLGNLSSGSNILGALSMRVSADGRPGLVTLSASDPSPQVTDPAPNRTFYVNTAADNTGTTTDPDDGVRCTMGNSEVCTLRDAITFANDDASDNINNGESDTIMLPAGTYKLTWQQGVLDSNGNLVTHLEVAGPVTIIGTGSGTIIDGQQNDTVFTINPGPVGSFYTTSLVFDMTIENLTIQNGKNSNNLLTATNDVGGCINWDAYGTGNLTLSSVTVQNCSVIWGPGGGVWAVNSTGAGNGTLTVTGSKISNNSTSEQGGGIYTAFAPTGLIVTNTTISNNLAAVSVNPSDPGGADGEDDGGGLFLTARPSSSIPQTSITGCSITSNTANGAGAGINTSTGFVLSSSLISSNTSTYGTSEGQTGNADAFLGGGVFSEILSPEVAPTITSTNLLKNFAYSAGGAIAIGSATQSQGNILQISLSRIFGNTSTNGVSGLALGQPDGTGGVGEAIASENWWGCNSGPTTTGDGCDQAAQYPTPSGTLTVAPWAQFLLSATTSTTINIGGNIGLSLTLNTDSSNNPITGAFPAVSNPNYTYAFSVSGVAADSIPNGTFTTSGTGTATLTPTGTGSGMVSATFDNQTDSVNFTVNAISTSLQLTVSPSTTYQYGGSPTAQVQFNPSSASGITASDFEVLIDGLVSSSFTLASVGTNLYQISGPFNLLSRGGHTFEVEFLATGGYTASHASTNLTVAVGAVNFTDSISPTNPVQGQGGTVTVTVTGVGTGATPTGSITYAFDGGTTHTIGLQPNGSAQIMIPTLIATGGHTLSLTYNGDTNYASSSTTVSVTIYGRSQTDIVALTSTAATINVYGLGFTPPSGQLAFTDLTTGSPVAAPVTLNVAHAVTALTPMVTSAPGAETLPVWTELADLNGDGILDLITSQFATDSVTVQLGNGDGTFKPATTVFSANGFGPAEVHAVSLRGDGKLDLIIGSFNLNEIAVLLGNGDGTFEATPSTYTLGSSSNTPTSLTSGDFNHDGFLDVAVANFGDNTISVLNGDGTGHLVLPESPISVGHAPEAIRAGDFNDDGVPDLAVANYGDGTITTLLNGGTGTFTASTLSIGSGAHSGPQALAVHGTGSSLLLAVANFKDNTISVLPSNGSGGFGPQTIVKVGKGPDDVNFADFNGDGNPDLVVANYTDGSVNLVLGSSGGNYSVSGPFSVGNKPYSAAVGDMNLDSTPDVVVSNCFSNNTGVLLDGTLISTSYTGLSLAAGNQVQGSYTPDGSSKYGSSTSTEATAP